jgi:hypothetical protein
MTDFNVQQHLAREGPHHVKLLLLSKRTNGVTRS